MVQKQPKLDLLRNKTAILDSDFPLEHPSVGDFRGVQCPLCFAKARMYLHRLEPGTMTRILLDHGQPIENVPTALVALGHKILSREKSPMGFWILNIQRTI